MNRIETLNELVETLNDSDPEDYIKVAKHMNIPKSEFANYVFWKPEAYTRNCIERTNTYELILICWNPGDATPIHNHAEQRCWVYQVEGMTSEIRYNTNAEGQLIECHRIELNPGRLTYMEDAMGYHSLQNSSEAKSMTLHLYISPIDSCEIFDDADAVFKMQELKYDSYKGTIHEKFVFR